MHFPVTDLTWSVKPHLCETRRHSRLALGRGYRGDRRDIRQILLDYLFSFGRRSGRLCRMRADNFLATPAPRPRPIGCEKCANTAEPSPKSRLKPSSSVCRIGRSCRCCQCRGTGRLTRRRPALRKPPIPPLLPSAPLRRSSPSPSVDQARARGYHGSPPGRAGVRLVITQPHGLHRGEMPAFELPRGPWRPSAASISRSV